MKPFVIRFFPRGWLAALAVLALVGCGGGDSGPGSGALLTTSAQPAALELVDAFAATLTGGDETPPAASTAQASGNLVVNPATRQMLAVVVTTGITGTAAHIHQAPPGVAGPIIIALAEATPGSGVWIARTTLTEDQFNNLKTGNLYFNVHSAAFPNGEIRGQIVSQIGSSGIAALGARSFLASLKGSLEVPPNASTALGAGAMVINPGTRQLAAAVLTSGISGTAAHIHEGAPDVSGPIIIPLAEVSPGSGLWLATATLSEAQFNSLQQGNLYFNVHSAAFPNGEIRGQILPQTEFIAGLVPASGASAALNPGPPGGVGSDTGTASMTTGY